MKKFETDKYLNGLALQDYFSLGYIFLIILGLLNNIIYYERLGINIFDYTTISDILLTPLNTLFSNYKITLIIIVLIIASYFLMKYLLIYLADYAKKMALKKNKVYQEFTLQPISASLYLLVCVFLGINIGQSSKVKSNIDNNEYRLNRLLTLNDNSQKEVYMVGQNSTYIFYVEKNTKDINIMPIAGNIKSIKKI